MTTTTPYNKFFEYVGKNVINLNTHVFKLRLVGPSFTFDPTHDVISDIGAVEIPDGHGYVAGGTTIPGTGWAFVDGKTVFSATDMTWTATGGDIGPAVGAVIYDSSASNKLCMYIDFGSPQTASEDTQFKLDFNSNGIFSI